MFQTPVGVGRGSKFLFDISANAATIAGSLIADLFIRTLPSYIGVKSLLYIREMCLTILIIVAGKSISSRLNKDLIICNILIFRYLSKIAINFRKG